MATIMGKASFHRIRAVVCPKPRAFATRLIAGRRTLVRIAFATVILIGSSATARGQATVALTTGPCSNDGKLVVSLDLVESSGATVVGGQFFLHYEPSLLQFSSISPGDDPFTNQVFVSVNESLGNIDYAVGVPASTSGVTAPPTRTMARITFDILQSECSVSNLVTFRATGPNGAVNKLSDDQVPGQPIDPLTRTDLLPVRLDIDPPVASSTSDVLDEDCYPDQDSAESAALLICSATDNCTANPVPVVETDGTCNATITVRFRDECNNLSNPLVFSTHIDGTKPTITCPSNIDVTAPTNQCQATVNYDPPIADDDCNSPPPVVHCDVPSGSVFVAGTTTTVTCTATDFCNHESDPCTFTITVHAPTTTIALHTSDCRDDGLLVVDIDMYNACRVVVGGQFFLHYDTSRLQFVSADPGDAPFTRQVYEVVNQMAGNIDYATGIPDGAMGTMAPTTMARVTFQILSSDCNASDLVSFRPTGPNGALNKLSDDQIPAQPILPLAREDLLPVTIDITPPTIMNTPADTDAECDSVPMGPPTLPASDNCDASVVEATLNPDQTTAGSCPQSYTITRTWSVTDACGNTGTATQHIAVHDSTAPTIDLPPADTEISCEQPLPVAPDTLPATDNCDGTVTSAALQPDLIVPGSCQGSYMVIRTWTAVDACGNEESVHQTITVNDTTAPVLSGCPASTASYQCAADVPSPPMVTAHDDCDGDITPDYNEDTTPGDCPHHLTIIRTWTATDACGNSDSCTQTITVNDTMPPVLSGCPAPTAVYQCTADVPSPPMVTAHDQCDGDITPDYNEDFIPGDCPNHLTIVRTWTATDACGNSDSCTQTITVNDTMPPVLSGCPASTASYQCAADVPSPPMVTAHDHCDGDITPDYNEDIIPGDCPNHLTIVRTWTATDACGNSDSCTQTITVNDDMPPTITLNGMAVVHLQCNTTPYQEDGAVWNDNCDGGPFDVTDITYTPSFPTTMEGTYTVHYNAMDVCGNHAVEVTRTVIIEEPSPTCNSPQPLTIECQCPNTCVPATDAVIAAWLASAEPVDGCDNDAMITSNDAPACFSIGTTTVTWTVLDEDDDHGPLMGQCSSTVTVVADTTAPVLSGCPAVTASYQCAADVLPPPIVTAHDHCDGDITPDYNEDIIPGDCPHHLTIIRTWTATDACGNSDSCTQTITVNDTTAPVLSGCPAVTASYQCAADVLPPPMVTAHDDCDGDITPDYNEDIIPGDCPNHLTIIRTWTATDACGNSDSCTQTITVNDTMPPVLSGCPAVTATFQCAADVLPPPMVTAHDDCDGDIIPDYDEDIIPGDCQHHLTIIRTWTATDACGNSDSCTQTITVQDTTPPEIHCPDDVEVGCASEIPPHDFAGGWVTDVCGGASFEWLEDQAGTPSCPNRYVIMRTYQATDDCGNHATCTQIITVNDQTPPQFTSCPGSVTVHAQPGSCDSAPVTYSALATDNCGGVPMITFNPPSGTRFPPGQTTVTATATDACGNTSECTFTVTNDGMYELVVDVELGGGVMAAGPYNRCITFELWDGGTLIHTEPRTFAFVGGNMPAAVVMVPCQSNGYSCITARDRLHTLRRTISPLPVNIANQYSADFTGPKRLIGGNLNDDRFVDLLDFNIYALQDLTPAPGGAGTNCTLVPPFRHADVNGDGLVNSIDFSFVANNFLQSRDENCDASPFAAQLPDNPPSPTGKRLTSARVDGPVTSISLKELHDRGLDDLAPMDLNGDGILDLTDMDLWVHGVRPKGRRH